MRKRDFGQHYRYLPDTELWLADALKTSLYPGPGSTGAVRGRHFPGGHPSQPPGSWSGPRGPAGTFSSQAWVLWAGGWVLLHLAELTSRCQLISPCGCLSVLSTAAWHPQLRLGGKWDDLVWCLVSQETALSWSHSPPRFPGAPSRRRQVGRPNRSRATGEMSPVQAEAEG